MRIWRLGKLTSCIEQTEGVRLVTDHHSHSIVVEHLKAKHDANAEREVPKRVMV